MVTPGRVHRVARSDDSHGCVLLFTEEFLALTRPDPRSLRRHPLLGNHAIAPVLDLSEPKKGEPIAGRIDAIRQESAQEDVGHREALGSLLNLLLVDVDRLVRNDGRFAEMLEEGSDDDLLHRFVDRLEESFHALHKVSDYADLLAVTPGHLNDVVRRRRGTTAGTMIRDRILLEAKRLLAHSQESIKEIAYGLGYEDPSYFTRLFREKVGVSPGEFRTESS